MRALLSGSHEISALLLTRGADLTARSRHGTLALHYAAGYKASIETVRLLLDAGAAQHITAANNHGRMPLSVAHERGRPDVVALFNEFQSRL